MRAVGVLMSLCRPAVAALSILLAGCVSAPAISAAAPCAMPQADGDWDVSTPDAAGFDATALCEALREVDKGNANIHGVVVERHGRIVAELYRAAPDHPINVFYGIPNPFGSEVAFDAQTLHDVRSVSKSVVGLLFGIAKEKGRISSLDASVLGAYPELADLRSAGRESISFRHLLTMSSGLEWDEWGRGALSSDETPLYWKTRQARFVFEHRLSVPPGSKFNYNGGGTATLADILVRVSGKPLVELVREELFEPLGIKQWDWVSDIHGRPLAFAGLRLRPRDMLKIGRLVSDRGRWRGRPVVPEQWIAESTREHISTGIKLFAIAGEEVGYGYQWWLGHISRGGREVRWAAAIGNGGQRIFAVPALDMTVVVTAGDYGSAQIQRDVNAILSAILSAVPVRPGAP